MTPRTAARRLALAAIVLATAFATSGCAGSISHWIVQTRNHQGDVALDHENAADASIAYQLALRVDPQNAHARAGFVRVQARIAQTLFTASRFEDAVKALDLADRYAPGDGRIEALRSQIEQAELKREIVVSNYPAYSETGLALQRAYAQVKIQSQAIVATLHRFDYNYDSNELSEAIRESYELDAQIVRLTDRLVQYRQLVDSGVPEDSDTNAEAPPASLLPLP